MSMHVSMCTCMRTCEHVRPCVSMCTCEHVHMCVRVCTCVCTCVYMGMQPYPCVQSVSSEGHFSSTVHCWAGRGSSETTCDHPPYPQSHWSYGHPNACPNGSAHLGVGSLGNPVGNSPTLPPHYPALPPAFHLEMSRVCGLKTTTVHPPHSCTHCRPWHPSIDRRSPYRPQHPL